MIPSVHTHTHTHLCLDLYFKNWANDCEGITEYDKDIPAVQKLQPIGPQHLFTTAGSAEVDVLLQKSEDMCFSPAPNKDSNIS